MCIRDRPYILCCLGVMGEGLNEKTEEVVRAFRKETGDDRIQMLFLTEQRPKDGRGGCFHPTIRTHEKMAQMVEKALKYWGL